SRVPAARAPCGAGRRRTISCVYCFHSQTIACQIAVDARCVALGLIRILEMQNAPPGTRRRWGDGTVPDPDGWSHVTVCVLRSQILHHLSPEPADPAVA